jgi:hypothetical protein
MAKGTRGIVVIVLIIAMVAQLALFLHLQNKRSDRSAPFSIELSPSELVGTVGEESVIEVTVKDEGEGIYGGEAVNLSGYAPGASVTIETKSIVPGEVAEVRVVPEEGREGENLTVTIIGKRGWREKTTATVMVAES